MENDSEQFDTYIQRISTYFIKYYWLSSCFRNYHLYDYNER